MITERQRQKRKEGIGSSDAPAILGVNPYKTGYDVWLEKTGRIVDEWKGNEATELGNMIEGSLLDWAAAETGMRIRKNQFRKSGILAANLDAIDSGKSVGFEAKTTGILRPSKTHEEWGDNGTDQVPPHVLIQCAHQMIVANLEKVFVPALIGGRGRMLYEIERDHVLTSHMEQELRLWWEKHVVGNTPPPDVPTPGYLERVIRKAPEAQCFIEDDLVAEWQEARQARLNAEKHEEACEIDVIRALGDYSVARCQIGLVSYLPIERNSFNQKAFEAAHPDLFSQFREKKLTKPSLKFKK